MGTVSWGVLIPDPVDILGSQFDGRALTNSPATDLAFYENPQVDKLLDRAAPEVDLKRRFELYQQAEQIIVRDAPCVFLGFGTMYGLRQRWLKGPLMDPTQNYRFDRVWISGARPDRGQQEARNTR